MHKILTPATMLSILATVALVGTGTVAFAGGGDNVHYIGYWTISIGNATGTIEISENTNIESIRDQAITKEEATDGYDNITNAKLTKAVNDSEQYFLVWKLTESDESNTKTIHVLDAGTGDPLIEPFTKQGGTCGEKKS